MGALITQEEIEQGWVSIPQELEMTIFLNGKQYINPKAIPELRKIFNKFEDENGKIN